MIRVGFRGAINRLDLPPYEVKIYGDEVSDSESNQSV